MARERFDHQKIEQSAQKKWEELDLYRTDLTAPGDPYYLLFEFPYPSGDLHIGHWYAFALTDIYARYLRMAGKNVLFPVGFDAFGLPAENAAIKHKADPAAWTYANMERMRSQIRSMGTSVDWSKEVVTCDPNYYKWTQWLFSKLFEHGLAERRNAAVKWCPFDMTVLANEQVIDGHCERCGNEVVEKHLTQWFLKITSYADRLLRDLDELPWREEIKDAQRAWIGESEGAKLSFQLHSYKEESILEGEDMNMAIEVFTTRPDTLYGATYVVLAPEHPLVAALHACALNPDEIAAYQEVTSRKTERERQEEKEKTGVLVGGVMAINPATKEPIPVYLADYVLASYGTGAVMAVPAHDERDFAFAQKFNLPIVSVIDPVTGTPQKDPADKQKIVAIVEHEGKVLTIKWKPELGGRLTVGGTAEEDEDDVVTAMREIKEETGYADLELVEQADEQVHHEYFAHSKEKAFIAHTTLLHFRLKSDATVEPALEENEKGKFEVEWLSIAQAKKEIVDPLHSYALARFTARTAYTGDGLLARSATFNGRPNREALWDIAASVGGERVKNYRMRDWLVSRQRYWGCPIPVVYDPEGTPHLVPSEHLPWTLPTDVDFTPSDASPLASSKELKERVTRIFGEGWTPEYDTLDTFVDSSWYYLRYVDPNNDHDFSDQALMKKWMPVDRYSGGSEHTTMHLLYARFFNKALYDLALVPTSEPFLERFNRGLILGPDNQKMSKSKGNVINPDEVVSKHGSDAVRMYLAFIGPYNEPGSYPWNLDGVEATRRFLDRVYALKERIGEQEESPSVLRALGVAAAKIATDNDRFKFNTAISALMIALKELETPPTISVESYHTYLQLLAPFAPHLSEHLWEETGGEGSIHSASWPVLPVEAEDEALIIVQINGKKRGEIKLSPEASESEALKKAREIEAIQAILHEENPKKIFYVKGRILNLVMGGP